MGSLFPLELTLWHPATRYDRALMDATFAPDFHEFGRSGRRYTRAELLDGTPHDFTATLHDFTEHPNPIGSGLRRLTPLHTTPNISSPKVNASLKSG